MNDAKHAILYKSEIEIAFGYIQAWPQRQCMCLYRDGKNFERFNLLVQSMIYLMIHHLKHIDKLIEDYKRLTINASSDSGNNSNNNNASANHNNNSNCNNDNGSSCSGGKQIKNEENAAKRLSDSVSKRKKSGSITRDTNKGEQQHVDSDTEQVLESALEVEYDGTPVNSKTNVSNNDNSSSTNPITSTDLLEKKEADEESGKRLEKNQRSKKDSQATSITPPILKTPTKSIGLLESPAGSGTVASGVGGDESISTSSNYSVSSPSSSSTQSFSLVGGSYTEETWILPEVEKFFLLVSKIFLLNFPLYVAYKHGTHARLDDISADEAQHLAIFCDLHDNDIPVYLLRNICVFCNSGGFAAMMITFEHHELPVSTAHAIIATVSNIKLWLNYGCIVQLFVPLRSRVLQYMCKLSDQNLRTAATRAMADFVWSAVRDPLDGSVSFDVEGLALAFKYFTSTTLTMRLAGKILYRIKYSHICYADCNLRLKVLPKLMLISIYLRKLSRWVMWR